MKIDIDINGAYHGAKESKNRYRIIYGGAGSGKSHYLAQETILNMLSSPDYYYLVVRKTSKSIRHSVFQLLIDLISAYELSGFFKVNKSDMSIRCINGSRLITSGLDDVEKLKSIAGINRIWIEEASEISENDFNQLDLRLRGVNKHKHQITLTFNPISELHWIKRRFFDIGVEDTFILKTTYRNNSHLDVEYIEKLLRLEKEDYQYYRIYALGEWGSLGNVIFTNWEKLDMSEIKDSFDNLKHGLDWGFASDPFATVHSHYDKTRKTIYIYDEIHLKAAHNDETAPVVKEAIKNDIIIADSAEPKSIADYKRLGIKCKGAKKGAGSVEHGIKWLQGHKIYIDPSCTDVIAEFSSYKWREDKDGIIIPKPVDANNHHIDALRYSYEDEMRNVSNDWGWN